MRFSVNWLREYVAVTEDPDHLARRLTLAGLPVDQVEQATPLPAEVVLARIAETRPHPNADRLTLCRVDAGDAEPVDVVCGAPNARPGLWTALARVGATLPGGTVIRRSKIRGETSHGMLCSAVELGMGEEADGILELAEGRPGTALSEILGTGEAALDIDVPSNRGDCLSYLGLAREVAALTGGAVRAPETPPLPAAGPVDTYISVSVEDPEDCPRFTAHVIHGVRIAPSPAWLVHLLESVGQRAINNVVDVTNFVLLEMGQPLHAFDLDLVGTGRLHVRRAREGERLTTLDGADRLLGPEVLAITDGERPIAAAGIMGGARTEVNPETHNILLEAAWFRPERILRGSRFLRLDTEASLRFRRGIDPGAVLAAARRAAVLMAEIAGGTVVPGVVEIVEPRLLAPRRIRLRPERVSALLGDPVPPEEVAARLTSFGFVVEAGARGEPWTVVVPSHRRDVSEECDLVEEVARHRGYDVIGSRAYNASAVHAPLQPEETRRRKVAETLRGFGFHEARTRVLTRRLAAVHAGLAPEVAEEAFLPLLEPPTREEEGLRVSLLPGLLDVIAHNVRHGQAETRVFEIGKIFHRVPGQELPRETLCVGLAAVGGEFGPSLERQLRSYGLQDLKGAVEGLLESFRIDAPKWRPYNAVGFAPAGAVEVITEGGGMGFVWEVQGPALSAWDIGRPVFAAELRVDGFPLDQGTPVAYREPSRFPAVRRDLALIVPAALTQEQVRSAIVAGAGAGFESIELFDHYTGRHIPEGHVGLGFRLTYRSLERTLEEGEVDAAVTRVVEALRREGIVRREV